MPLDEIQQIAVVFRPGLLLIFYDFQHNVQYFVFVFGLARQFFRVLLAKGFKHNLGTHVVFK